MERKIDERYITLIAGGFRLKPERKVTILEVGGFLIAALGIGLLYFDSNKLGWLILAIATPAVITGLYFDLRDTRKARKEFIQYCHEKGELPSYPEAWK